LMQLLNKLMGRTCSLVMLVQYIAVACDGAPLIKIDC